MTSKKYVYSFGDGNSEGDASMKNLLGGKGANLAEMSKMGLPVPLGFTITTEVCDVYYKNDRKFTDEVKLQVKEALQKGEDIIQKDQLGLLNLIKRALQKVTETAANSNLTVVKLLNHYVVLFSQMIKAYLQGTYKKLPAIALAKIVAVLIYFISPFDFICFLSSRIETDSMIAL